jgi:hypothetical protein
MAAAGTTDDDGEDSNGVPAACSHLCAKAWRRHTWLQGHSTVASATGNMARIGQRVPPEHAIGAPGCQKSDTGKSGDAAPRRMTQHTCVPALTDQGAKGPLNGSANLCPRRNVPHGQVRTFSSRRILSNRVRHRRELAARTGW